jgi:hypothetical protein
VISHDQAEKTVRDLPDFHGSEMELLAYIYEHRTRDEALAGMVVAADEMCHIKPDATAAYVCECMGRLAKALAKYEAAREAALSARSTKEADRGIA